MNRRLSVLGLGFVLLFTLTTLTLPGCSARKPIEDKVWNIRGKMVTLAESLVGLNYRYGGEDLDGFDCSGLVFYIYDCYGVKIPRTAKKMLKLKPKVSLKKAKPGDILIFKLKRRRWHTGFFVGDNMFIHAPNRRAKLRREPLNKYWRKRLKAVVHIIDE